MWKNIPRFSILKKSLLKCSIWESPYVVFYTKNQTLLKNSRGLLLKILFLQVFHRRKQVFYMKKIFHRYSIWSRIFNRPSIWEKEDLSQVFCFKRNFYRPSQLRVSITVFLLRGSFSDSLYEDILQVFHSTSHSSPIWMTIIKRKDRSQILYFERNDENLTGFP